MDFSLKEQNGDEFAFSLKITKSEAAALDGAAMTALWGQIRELTKANRIFPEEASKTEQKEEQQPFVAKNYKNVKPDVTPEEVQKNEDRPAADVCSAGSASGDAQTALYEQLLPVILAQNEFDLPEELQEEINFVYKGTLQGLKYRRMFGDDPQDYSEPDPEQLYEEVAADVTSEYKENLLLKSIIEQEHLDCTFEELEAEAKAMAKRDDCSLEMVKRFMGEDYAFLKGDLLKKKAKQLICKQADVQGM